MKTVAVIPAYNEEKHIQKVIAKTKTFVDEIIVVDDGSKDATLLLAKALNVTVLKHKTNLGKGAALKTGCEAAKMLNADVIITLDADGQHRPEDIPHLLEKLQKENLDIVFGVRPMNKKMPGFKKMGNKFLSLITSFFSGIKLTDTQCGLRAFKTNILDKIMWQARDYYVETEMIINAGKNQLKYASAPITTIYLDHYKGTTIIDGFKIFLKILKGKILCI